MFAVPSELFEVPAVLLLTPDPLPEPEFAFWLSPDAVLVDSLPVAVLPPVLAVADPVLETSAFWSTITTQPPVPQTFVSLLWLTVVPESLPVASASPLALSALPPESFLTGSAGFGALVVVVGAAVVDVVDGAAVVVVVDGAAVVVVACA
jgi:hypothetical protein